MFNRARFKPRVRGARSNVISPPLDGLPAATFAYGPRRMRSAYNGAAMRVRRADNAELDVGFATAPQTRTNLMPVPLVDNGPAVPGITTTQVGSGTEFGLPYIDIRWQGTATGAGALVFRQGGATTYNPAVHAAVTPGLVYTASVGYRFIAGTVPSQTLTMRLIQRAANAVGLSFGSVYTLPAPTAAMQRAVAMDVIVPDVVYAHAQIGYNIAINDVLDVTLRFYANNLELGIGNIRPLLNRNVPEVVAGIGDLDTETLMNFVGGENLLTFSEQFDNAVWSKTAGLTVIANAAVAPNGTMTADRIVPPNGTGNAAIAQGFTYLSSIYSPSFYAKADGYNFVQFFSTNAASSGFINFDLTTGAVTNSSLWTGSAENVGNDWWRLTVQTNTMNPAVSNIGAHVLVTGNEGRYTAVTTNGTSGIFLWGYQLRVGTQAGRYNPTTTTAISLTAANSGFVGTYYDQTGNARHLTQTTAANQPSGLIAGAVVTENGRAILSCDGVNDVLSSAAGVADAVMGGKPFTATHITFGSNAQFGWTGNGLNGAASVPRLYFQRNAYAYNNNGTVTVGAASGGRVLSYTHDGVTTASARRDGVMRGTGTEPVIPTFGGGGHLSVPLFASGVAQAGGFSEFVAFSQLLTTAQLQQLERNIGAYYGVTVA
jgi:hypothetical protein